MTGRLAVPVHVYELNLSPRTESALARAGIFTIAELTDRTVPEMRLVHRIGRYSLMEIITELQRHNLSLATGRRS